MTRGTAYLITDEKVYYSDEFNGDMYLEGYGKDFLKKVHESTEETFDKNMKEFNKSFYNYELFETYSESISKNNSIKVKPEIIEIDMVRDYYVNFFSDWIFFKNESTKTIKFKVETDYDNSKIQYLTINPSESIAISFGRFDGHSKIQ